MINTISLSDEDKIQIDLLKNEYVDLCAVHTVNVPLTFEISCQWDSGTEVTIYEEGEKSFWRHSNEIIEKAKNKLKTSFNNKIKKLRAKCRNLDKKYNVSMGTIFDLFIE